MDAFVDSVPSRSVTRVDPRYYKTVITLLMKLWNI